MMLNIGHLLSSLEKCLFKSFAHLKKFGWFFYCGSQRVLYIFWIWVPYQIYHLQIFSLTLWIVLSFSWCCKGLFSTQWSFSGSSQTSPQYLYKGLLIECSKNSKIWALVAHYEAGNSFTIRLLGNIIWKNTFSGSLLKDLFVKLGDAEYMTSVPCRRRGMPHMLYFSHYTDPTILLLIQTLLENVAKKKKINGNIGPFSIPKKIRFLFPSSVLWQENTFLLHNRRLNYFLIEKYYLLQVFHPLNGKQSKKNNLVS